MHEWLKHDNLELTELKHDYKQFGKQEHIAYLQQAALTVREYLEKKIL
ncbi:hypothetical protein [Marinoscillum sp. MHG1-6]|nr:hypothetical protein [Marinoscillum sp. MHG1-6]